MSRSQFRERLYGQRPLVAPSLLMCDFANLGQELERLESAGVELLHLDVMDGHFVPNLTYGFPILEAIRRHTTLPLDVHLMISHPGEYVERYVEAGADQVTVHVEADDPADEVLRQIRSAGAAAGVAINPPTPLSEIEDLLPLCDSVLVMSVMPGFGGQAFDPVALGKLKALREQVGSEVLLEIDGGVNEETIGSCTEAGADLLVVGSAIFKHQDYREPVKRLHELARQHFVAQG